MHFGFDRCVELSIGLMVHKLTIEDFKNGGGTSQGDLAVRRPLGLAVLAIPNR